MKQPTNRWLIPIVVFVMVMMPPYVSTGLKISEVLRTNVYILTHAIKPRYTAVFPMFNLLTLLLLAGVYTLGNKMRTIFSAYVFVAYVISGILQNVSISDRYGLAINTSVLLLTLLVASFWLRESFLHKNDFSRKPELRRIITLLPFALLALWYPVNPTTLHPDFDPRYFLSSGSSLTFCMMTIVTLVVLISYAPNVNYATLRVTSLVGLLIGIGNLWLEFIAMPDLAWIGVLHIPLVCLSATGLFVVSKWTRKPQGYL